MATRAKKAKAKRGSPAPGTGRAKGRVPPTPRPKVRPVPGAKKPAPKKAPTKKPAPKPRRKAPKKPAPVIRRSPEPKPTRRPRGSTNFAKKRASKTAPRPQKRGLRVEIKLVSFQEVQHTGIGPSPDRVAAAMRKALRALLKRMSTKRPDAADAGYFTLGLKRGYSRKMEGPNWERQDVFIGATDYFTAYESEWPSLMAGPNRVKQYRAAVLSVLAEGFYREGNS